MGLGRRLTATAALLVLTGGTVACTDTSPQPPTPLEWEWREVVLPEPPAGTGIGLRSAAFCDGHWFLGGAYRQQAPTPTSTWLGQDDPTDPAVWTSRDGETWTEVRVAAFSYYGVRSEMLTAACRNGQLVTLGGKPGGAHGNPRISSFYPVPIDSGDVLTEVSASFELYGGPNATNVGRLTAGPPGYLIVGNRSSGAAVWFSPDGAVFEIVEGAPVLAHSPERSTWAADAAFHDGAWIVVGSTVATGRADRDAASWRSTDARMWTMVATESGPSYDELNVVAELDGSLVALGQEDGAFQAWRLDGDTWRRAGRFGDTRAVPTAGPWSAAIPIDLAAAGGRLVAVVQAGGARHLWTSADGGQSWQALQSPVPIPAGGGLGTALVGVPGQGGQASQILLAVDDGSTARAFTTAVEAG